MIDQELSLTDRRRQAVRLDIAAGAGGRVVDRRGDAAAGEGQGTGAGI
ncbi:hypothetical protein [Nocardia cyriacigeorgica]|nr:hypothetical protein [Nocardia cyriacigeorgica]